MSNQNEDNIVLLFFDNFEYPKVQYNVEEIFFNKAIVLQQIRILKQDSNPHTKLKSMQSITQKDIIYNFEIFGRNLKKINDKFEILFPCNNINTNNGESDCIFPFLKEFVTNHIVIRGKFEKITMCIYGKAYDESDKTQIIDNAKLDVPLEKLDEIYLNNINCDENEKYKITNEELEFSKLYSIENLIQNYSYIKNNVKNYEFKRVYNLNKPNMNMVERTKNGYIYYENDMFSSLQNLNDFYLNKDSSLSDEKVVQHQKTYMLLFNILKLLFSRNFAYLDMDCVFRNENLEIYSKIPFDNVINIISNSLNGNIYGYTEIKFGLKLLKFISNSNLLVDKFISSYGMEKLYKIILINNENQFNNNIKDSNSSILIKALALEIIYKLITFKSAFERIFETIDRKEFKQQYFLIKESTKEINESNENKNKEKEKEKEKRKEKEKEKSRSKSKEHKSKHKDKHKKKHKDKKSKSKSSSKSSSRERSRNKNRDSSNDSHSTKKNLKKKHRKIPLKNGYQILNTLLISKRNILLQNIIKHIINKINLMLYLKNLNNLILNNIILSKNNENTIINIDFNKVIYTLECIFDLIKKIEISYEKKKLEDNTFLDKDYPYKYYWIDYIKTNRKFYGKNLNDNNKNEEEEDIYSLLRNETNSFTNVFQVGEISNEICQILEQYNLLQNLTIILMNKEIQSFPQFFEIGIIIKNIIAYLVLSRGGINFFSKNYNHTQNLMQVIKTITSPLEDKIDEKCFFKVKLKTLKGFNNILLNKSLYENIKYEKINDILINSSCKNIEYTDEYILRLHFLQLKYLLQYSFYFLNLFDDYIGIIENIDTLEQSEINDKSLDIFLEFEKTFKNNHISEQSFLSFCNNDFFFKGLIDTINKYIQSGENITEYEGHISVLTRILFKIFSSLDNNSDIFLLFYGKTILKEIIQLKKIIVNAYDIKDLELINTSLFNDLDVLISLLKPIENKDIKSLMTIINDSIFNNIMKYNLNKKVINIKDEKLMEYLDDFKLNIQNYQNKVENFLEELKLKGSLINEIFTAVKILNLNVKYIFFLIFFLIIID